MSVSAPRNERVELQAWYLRGLAPKLAAAARSGKATPAAVAALDRQLRAFLDIPDSGPAEEAA